MILFKVAGLSVCVEKGNNFEWFMRYFIFEVSIIQDSESGSKSLGLPKNRADSTYRQIYDETVLTNIFLPLSSVLFFLQTRYCVQNTFISLVV